MNLHEKNCFSNRFRTIERTLLGCLEATRRHDGAASQEHIHRTGARSAVVWTYVLPRAEAAVCERFVVVFVDLNYNKKIGFFFFTCE